MPTTFHHHNKSYTIEADKFNDLSARQLIALCEIFVAKLPVDVAQLKALQILLNKTLLRFLLMPDDAKAAMLPSVAWVFEKNTLTQQLLPSYKGFYGPASEWDNLTMAEWNACEIYYAILAKDESNIEVLNKLVAILYRLPKQGYDIEKDSDGDIRVPFNPNEISYWAKQIASWPHAVKYAILMWYDGCREAMRALYDIWNEPSGDSDAQPGMFEVIRGLCGERYGSWENVERMNVHKALRELELSKQEAEKIKAQIPTT